MPSSQTTRNRLEKQASGENANTWGDRFNSNFADLADFSLDGMTSFALSTTKVLTANNYAADEARARYLNITSGSGGTVTIPNVEKIYLVRNAASGTVTFTTGSGTTADVPAGTIAWIVCEAGNVVRTITTYQPSDALLTAIAALSMVADRYIYGTGADAVALGTITSFGRSLLDDADAATARATLQLGTAATAASADFQPVDSDLTAIAALTTTSFGRGLLALADATALRTSAALGNAATFDEMTAAEYRANTANKLASTDQIWASAAAVALTDAATVAVDMSAGFNFTLSIGGNRTLGAPSNMKEGQAGVIAITQTTGNHTLDYNAAWVFENSTHPVLSAPAGAKDLLFYQVLPGGTTVFGSLRKAIG